MPEFIPGIELSDAYYWEAVRPVLDRHFPGLRHSAALIGYGSDVIGLDTPTSRDHMWGPRLMFFLPSENFHAVQTEVSEALRQELPVRFRGYSTHFSRPNPKDHGVRNSEDIEHGPVEHLIFFHTLAGFWQNELGVDPESDPSPADWLTFAEHRLLSLTAGKVFHDDLGLEEARRRFSYYPHEVWLYLLSVQWQLISQEEAFVGRTSSVGDELGSRLITGRQVEKLMRLCFLMEKRIPPYSKWFGSAFQRLACAARMGPLLEGALAAGSYPERETFLAHAYTLAVELHNALNNTPHLDTRTRTYSGWHMFNSGIEEVALDDPRNTRPHLVIFGGRIADAIAAQIRDPQVLALRPDAGSVNQFLVESSAPLESTDFCCQVKDSLTL